jgi:hypothetical protein
MSWTIIVASSEADQLEELVNGAKQVAVAINSTGDPSVVCATSVEDVHESRSSATGRSQLLIVTASLLHRQSSPEREAAPGLDLIRSISTQPDPPACILVSDHLEHYFVAQEIERCEWLAVNASTNYVQQCLQLARKLGVVSADPIPVATNGRQAVANASGNVPRVRSPSVVSSPVPKPPAHTKFKPSARCSRQPGETYALLEVVLPSNAQNANVKLEIRNQDGLVQGGEQIFLGLKQRAVNELVRESQKLKDKLSDALADEEEWANYGKIWEKEYRELADRVSKLFWSPKFSFLYGMARREGNGNVRLRFNLEQPLFGGLWEAMFDFSSPRFAMLDHTITRRASSSDPLERIGADTVGALADADPRDLNVLVIRSDVPDGSAPKGPNDQLWRDFWATQEDLRELPHLGEEVQVLRDLRRPRGRTSGDGAAEPRVKVDVLRGPQRWGKPWSLADLVERRLKDRSRRYDIVHFAGHALFDESAENGDGRGYLVFSGYPTPRAVTVAEVASWFEKAGVQLVYLSCCRSSAAAAALELARYKVPMTIGFNWNLDDEKAVDCAKYFYNALLEKDLKVCHAMREARRKLHDEYGAGDPIWASPVLVAQPLNWMHAEGVLRPQSPNRRAPPRPPRPPRTKSPIVEGAQAPLVLHS